MEVIRELVTRWGFEIDDKPLQNLDEAFTGLMTTAAKVGAAMAAAAGTIYGFAKSAADAADKVVDTSIRLGIATDTLQELGYAAQLNGSSFDEMAQSLNFLNRNTGAALQGSSEMQKTFAKLGLTVTDLKTMKADQLFGRLADRFAKMPEGPAKAAAAMDIFGKSGANMIQTLNLGSEGLTKLKEEANALGGVMNTEALEAGTKFNDSLDRMWFAISAVKNMVGIELFPVLTELVDKFVDFVKVNREVIATKIGFFLQGLGKFLRITWRFSMALVDSLSGVIDLFGGLEKVATAVAWVFGIFASGALLYGIGALVTALIGLTAWFTLANIAALAIPIAIGLLAVAIGLVIEDIVAFFQGRESVTGIIVEKFRAAVDWVKQKFSELPGAIMETVGSVFTWLEGKFTQLPGWLQVLITVLMTPFRAIAEAVRTVISLIDIMRGKTSAPTITGFGGLMSAIGEKAGRVFGVGTDDGTLGGSASLSTALGFDPRTAPAAPGGSQNTMTNQIQSPMTFNIGQGVDFGTVKNGVQSGVNSGLGDVLRGTSRAFQGAGGY